MTRLMLDPTNRTAATPDPRRWMLVAWANSVPPIEGAGVINFTSTASTLAHHVVGRLNTPTLDQGNLLLLTRIGSAGSSRFRAWVSHSGEYSGATGENATSALGVSINQAGDFSLIKTAAGVATVISAAITGKVVNNTPTWVRLERTAGRVRARAWASAGAEPVTWDHDIVDDGTVPTGKVGFSALRGSAAGANWTVATPSIYTPAGGIPDSTRAKVYRRPDGSRLPYGRHSQFYNDDASADAPPFLTGTSTRDAVNGLRTISAAASSTASLSLPPAAGEALILTVHNFRLTSDTNISAYLRFSDPVAGTTYDLSQTSSQATAQLVSAGVVTPIPYRFRDGTLETIRHRTLTLVILTDLAQLVAMEGTFEQGVVIGSASLPVTINRTKALTASVGVSATSATPQTLAYSGLQLEVQRL